MKRILGVSLSVLFGLSLALAHPSGAAPKPPRAKAVPAGMISVTGPVKGAPVGKTFVVATRKGATTVDASRATIREHGKFASIAAIKAGTLVTARGTLAGTTLMAKAVNIHARRAGGKKGSAPRAGGRKH